MKHSALLLKLSILLLAPAVSAHHSLTGTYDTAKQTTIEGTVTELLFVNPHPFVTVEVKAASGEVQTWKLELDNRYELVQIGMTAQTLKPGDRVIVRGSPGRSTPHILYVNRLDRPADGFRYEQIGTSPRIRNAQ